MLTETYLRRSIETVVRFAENTGVIETLEGSVAYKARDAIVTGLRGESWPVQRKRFEKTYEPTAETHMMGNDGLYRRKPIIVTAYKTEKPAAIVLSDNRGILQVRVGDWILEGPEGDQWAVADGIFQDTYVPFYSSSGGQSKD